MDKTKKTMALVFLSIGVVAVISFILLTENSIMGDVVKETNKADVTLAISPIPHSVLIFIAEEKGYFNDEGLNVKMVKFSTGKDALDAMIADGADFATTADFPLTLAGLSGQETYVVATIGFGDDIKVIARKDRGINSIEDLVGKKIATKKGGGGDFFMQKLFEQKNMVLDQSKVINLNPPDMPTVLARGDVDAYITWEPHISNGKKLLADNAIVFEPKGIYGETWNVVVNSEFESKNPDIVKKFVSALVKADDFMDNHPLESSSIAQKYSGASEEIVDIVFGSFNIEVLLDKDLTDQMTETARWLVNQGNFKAESIPDYNHMIKTQYLDEISPQSVTI